MVNLRDVVSQRKQRSAVAIAGPDADPVAADLPVPGRGLASACEALP